MVQVFSSSFGDTKAGWDKFSRVGRLKGATLCFAPWKASSKLVGVSGQLDNLPAYKVAVDKESGPDEQRNHAGDPHVRENFSSGG